jgi:hypothetical protein
MIDAYAASGTSPTVNMRNPCRWQTESNEWDVL